MKTLIRSNIGKNLNETFGQKIIMGYNIDGTHGKNRLRDYKNVYTRLIGKLLCRNSKNKLITTIIILK